MDPLTIGAIAAPIIGGLFGKSGQSSANKANAEQARLNREFQAGETAIQRDFSSGEAQKNREYQERLSSTAYQRSMADMKAGGLNPMLAYMKGGASTPTGATGQASAASGSTANMQNEWAAMANSAANIGMQLAQVKNIQAQTNKTNVDAALTATQLPKGKIGEDIWSILQKDISSITNSARDFQQGQQEWWKSLDIGKTLDKADDYVWKTMKEYWGKALPKGADPNKKIKVLKK